MNGSKEDDLYGQPPKNQGNVVVEEEIILLYPSRQSIFKKPAHPHSVSKTVDALRRSQRQLVFSQAEEYKQEEQFNGLRKGTPNAFDVVIDELSTEVEAESTALSPTQ